jgi:imidazolonepropionase-like amidohydrolase
MKRYILATILSACLLQTALVVEAKPKDSTKDANESVIALQGADVIDGTGSPIKKNQTIIVKGKQIQSIQSGSAKIPAGARVVDVTGKTIMPCIVCAHAHPGLLKGNAVAGANCTEENYVRHLKLFGKYGVGIVMSLGDDHDSILAVRDKRNKGEIGGPYVMTAGHGIGVPGAAPPLETGADEIYRPTTVAEAVKHVDDLAEKKVDIIKFWVDDLHGTAPKMKPEMYKAIIAQAHKHGLKTAVHIWKLADAKACIEAGVDVLAHSVRDMPIDNELISLMKSRKVGITPTLAVDDSFYIFAEKPEWVNSKFFQDSLEPGILEYLKSDKYHASDIEREATKTAKANLKKLVDGGVKVAFGTDSGGIERPCGFDEHRELELMVEAGLTPQQALQCATKNSAELLGVDDRMGTLKAGKLANLIVLDGDPYADILNTRKISSVWIDGVQQ